jgi:PhoH-like ATPase
MPKRFLLDTNVFMRDANALYTFQDNDIYIPLGVIDELDKFKRGTEDYNANARAANRILKSLLKQYLSSSSKEERKRKMEDGIPLGEGFGNLYFLIPENKIRFDYADPEILYHLKNDRAKNNEEELILVSNDTGLQIKAYALGYAAEEYRHDRNVKDLHELLDLPEMVDLPAEILSDLRKNKRVSLSKEKFKAMNFFNNQYLYVEHDSLLLKYVSTAMEHTFEVIPDQNIVYGIMPKNKEQRFLLDLCLDDEIKIASVLGKAGTGKTLVTLAAALQKVLKKDQGNSKYERVIITRPVMEIGQGLGFLPGDIDEKIEPYKGPIYDAAEVIFSVMRKKVGGVDEASLDYLIQENKVQFMPLTYIRGRNLARSYIIVDEAQNLTPSQAKTLATRTGQDSKIIFQGDPYQIDAPHLDETNNGLVTLTKRLLGEKIFGTTILKKTERSDVAELVARLM